MIRILEKYLFVHILGGTLLVLFILVSLDALFIFLDELDDVGSNQYGYLQAFVYVFYSLPGRIYEFTPTALLIGSLIGLGSLASNNEITAMRAAGMSRSGFIISTMKIGVLFAVALFVMGEFLSPMSQRYAEEMRADALSKELSVNRKGGIWLRVDKRIIFAQQVVDQAHLKNVKIFSFSGLQLSEMLEAKLAVRSGDKWSLEEVTSTIISTEKITVEKKASLDWGQLLPVGMLEMLKIEPQAMSLKELWQYTAYLRANNLDSENYRLAIWNRFAYPFTILVMLILALPFLFSQQRSGGMGQRLFLGIVLGTVFFLVNTMINQVGVVYGLHPSISAFIVPLVTAIGAVLLLRRV